MAASAHQKTKTELAAPQTRGGGTEVAPCAGRRPPAKTDAVFDEVRAGPVKRRAASAPAG